MARDITPVVPHPLLEEDPSVIKAVAERAGEGLSGWAAFAAVMTELQKYGYSLTRESLPNRKMNSIMGQWHSAPQD